MFGFDRGDLEIVECDRVSGFEFDDPFKALRDEFGASMWDDDGRGVRTHAFECWFVEVIEVGVSDQDEI